MTRTLRITGPDSDQEIAVLSWRDGVATVVSACNADLRAELEDIVQRGLAEWVSGEDGPRHRVTLASDPLFLARLGEDMHRQFRFAFEVSDGDE